MKLNMPMNILSVLPCPVAPPEAPVGGKSWYSIEKVRYKCPNGHQFNTSKYFEYSYCSPLKTWEPPGDPEMPHCVG